MDPFCHNLTFQQHKAMQQANHQKRQGNVV